MKQAERPAFRSVVGSPGISLAIAPTQAASDAGAGAVAQDPRVRNALGLLLWHHSNPSPRIR